MRKPFRVEDSRDLTILSDWAHLYWNSFIRKTLEGSGTLYYHECCFSFSRKGFQKRSGHPSEMTVSVHRLPELKRCGRVSDLIEWLSEKIKQQYANGKTPYFPSINSFHNEMPENTFYENTHERESLGKRYRDLEKEVEIIIIKIEELKHENRKLLSSSQNWSKLYAKTKLAIDMITLRRREEESNEESHQNNSNFDMYD